MGAFGGSGFAGGFGSQNRQRSLGVSPQQGAGDFSAYFQPQQQQPATQPTTAYAAYRQPQSPGQAQPIHPQSQGTPYNPSAPAPLPQAPQMVTRTVPRNRPAPDPGFDQWFASQQASGRYNDRAFGGRQGAAKAEAQKQWNRFTPQQRQGELGRAQQQAVPANPFQKQEAARQSYVSALSRIPQDDLAGRAGAEWDYAQQYGGPYVTSRIGDIDPMQQAKTMSRDQWMQQRVAMDAHNKQAQAAWEQDRARRADNLRATPGLSPAAADWLLSGANGNPSEAAWNSFAGTDVGREALQGNVSYQDAMSRAGYAGALGRPQGIGNDIGWQQPQVSLWDATIGQTDANTLINRFLMRNGSL